MTITISIVTAATVVIGGGFQAGSLTVSLPSIPSARPVRVGDGGQDLVQLTGALVIQGQEHFEERGGGRGGGRGGA